MAQTSRRRIPSQLATGQSRALVSRSRPRCSLNDLRQALRGVHSYLPTPFHANLEIDPEGMRQNAAFYAEAGGQPLSLVVAAGLGELFSLGFEEHREVVSAVADGAGGRLPVVAGVRGGYRFALRMPRNSVEAGADAILIFPPAGGPQTLEGQRRYFTEIAHSVGIGVLIYPRTQRDDWSSLLEGLADLPNVIGFQDSGGGVDVGHSLGSLVPDRFLWIARGEGHAVKALPAGARAYTAAMACLAPEACREFWQFGTAGSLAEMNRILEQRMAPMAAVRSLRPGYSAAGIKVALETVGRAGGPTRPPMGQVEAEDRPRIEAIVKRHAET